MRIAIGIFFAISGEDYICTLNGHYSHIECFMRKTKVNLAGSLCARTVNFCACIVVVNVYSILTNGPKVVCRIGIFSAIFDTNHQFWIARSFSFDGDLQSMTDSHVCCANVGAAICIEEGKKEQHYRTQPHIFTSSSLRCRLMFANE